MFVNGEQTITTRLQNISLKENSNMQPKADRPPVCPKAQLPTLHLTPSGGGPKRADGSPQSSNSPWLLKPQHVMPPTPPPQSNAQPQFFAQRIG